MTPAPRQPPMTAVPDVEPHGFTAVAPMRASTFAKASAGTRLAFLHGLTSVASAYAEASADMSADKSCEGG